MRTILWVFLLLCALVRAHCVQVVDVQVTGVYPECFYVEEYDRSAGIGVHYSGTAPHLGDLLYLSGCVSSLPSGERVFVADTMQVVGELADAAQARPVLLHNRAVGGTAVCAYTPGVTGGTGMNTIGLLVTTSGRVTRVESGRFFLSDGHTVEVGVVVEGSLTVPQPDSYVLVSGIATMDETHAPMIRPRSGTDLIDLGIYGMSSQYGAGQSMQSMSLGSFYDLGRGMPLPRYVVPPPWLPGQPLP